ncbi:tRNA (cytidine(34)-2'-O)-methyltransferase [Andreesenia angusta]|uniref:Putative tRNA (cytidine(34)-2'-O)-methyltransferase n=1 Tax=Andreesenia angusta TaxID=39480 RepID=A0A1S1V6R4_9FIRM|nr:tRNA (uridine(34)/cytosine(34)/5-carboxymethylaminomethyluridine(34)-2'-O)-methyltransferase TrmL [Andreesenia angusta]OHW62232.1 tRNA (cytidine(34)-2'-O)-methyltransferase [Andreesenia angusta]
MNIVLFQPEIPQNTGNIARTCAATGSRLHLIKPLGFSIDEKAVKRAGLDYWELLDINVYESAEEFFEKNADGVFYFSSTKAQKNYTDFSFQDDSYIVFGRETSGLPDWIMEKYSERLMRIPMVDVEKARSLNLSNAVAIVVYEALRQVGFKDLR